MSINDEQKFIMIDGMKLEKVSVKQIKALRNTKKSLLIVKNHKRYYYAEVEKDFSGIRDDRFKSHMCGIPCKRLKPLSDEAGGCEKVRKSSKEIEDFEWIKIGYETLNTSRGFFVVCDCDHYEKEKRKRLSNYEIMKAKKNIAELYLKQ